MSGIGALLVFSAVWASFGIVSGGIGARLPLRWLRRDRGPLRLRRFETGGSWYRRRLGIDRWKDRLPEAGALFAGVSKATLPSRSPAALDRFATETRRAEWVHWANLLFGFTFLVWTPAEIGWFMVAFGIVVHAPFIAVQRYNRLRLGRLRGRRAEIAEPWSWRRRVLVGSLVVMGILVGFWAAVLRPDPAREVTVTEARQRLDDAAATGSDRGPSGIALPVEGVYRYRGEGTERLDRPPISQRQGPEMPGTVTHTGAGCWSFRIDYSTKHSQTWDLCRRGDDLVEVGGRSEQKLDLKVAEVAVTVTSTCQPDTVLQSETVRVDDPPRQQRCSAQTSATDEEVRVEGPATFVGVETVEVDGRPLRTCHHRHERTMSGGQTGTERLDLWLDCDNGLPIRNERRVSARTDSPLGMLTYTEEGSFTLQSVEPDP